MTTPLHPLQLHYDIQSLEDLQLENRSIQHFYYQGEYEKVCSFPLAVLKDNLKYISSSFQHYLCKHDLVDFLPLLHEEYPSEFVLNCFRYNSHRCLEEMTRKYPHLLNQLQISPHQLYTVFCANPSIIFDRMGHYVCHFLSNELHFFLHIFHNHTIENTEPFQKPHRSLFDYLEEWETRLHFVQHANWSKLRYMDISNKKRNFLLKHCHPTNNNSTNPLYFHLLCGNFQKHRERIWSLKRDHPEYRFNAETIFRSRSTLTYSDLVFICNDIYFHSERISSLTLTPSILTYFAHSCNTFHQCNYFLHVLLRHCHLSKHFYIGLMNFYRNLELFYDILHVLYDTQRLSKLVDTILDHDHLYAWKLYVKQYPLEESTLQSEEFHLKLMSKIYGTIRTQLLSLTLKSRIHFLSLHAYDASFLHLIKEFRTHFQQKYLHVQEWYRQYEENEEIQSEFNLIKTILCYRLEYKQLHLFHSVFPTLFNVFYLDIFKEKSKEGDLVCIQWMIRTYGKENISHKIKIPHLLLTLLIYNLDPLMYRFLETTFHNTIQQNHIDRNFKSICRFQLQSSIEFMIKYYEGRYAYFPPSTALIYISTTTRDSTICTTTECPVCMDQPVEHVLVPCNHGYCLSCLKRWIIISPSCPFCRHPL